MKTWSNILRFYDLVKRVNCNTHFPPTTPETNLPESLEKQKIVRPTTKTESSRDSSHCDLTQLASGGGTTRWSQALFKCLAYNNMQVVWEIQVAYTYIYTYRLCYSAFLCHRSYILKLG